MADREMLNTSLHSMTENVTGSAVSSRRIIIDLCIRGLLTQDAHLVQLHKQQQDAFNTTCVISINQSKFTNSPRNIKIFISQFHMDKLNVCRTVE